MGFSVRYVFLGFLALVALCAVFFTLGFLVGYNERPSTPAPVVERVAPGPENPPPVVAPQEAASGATPGTSSQSSPPASAGAEPPKSFSEPAEVANPTSTSASLPSKVAVAGPPVATGTGLTIQVAALHARQDAEALVNVLRGRGYPVFLVTPEEAKAPGNLFRVQVGPYPTREQAEKVRQKLSDEGFKPFIKHP